MKITIRPATHSDIPAILALHAAQQKLQGTNFESPPFDGGTLLEVTVGEADGRVIGCFYCEITAELRFIGVDPRFTAKARREVGGLVQRLKGLGIRYLECYVPKQLKLHIGKPLLMAGFEDKENELAYFSKDLR